MSLLSVISIVMQGLYNLIIDSVLSNLSDVIGDDIGNIISWTVEV